MHGEFITGRCQPHGLRRYGACATEIDVDARDDDAHERASGWPQMRSLPEVGLQQ